MRLNGMIEHRLYSIERDKEDHLVLCTPKRATWYRLQGYEVFDFTESLDMEPEYFSVDKSTNDAIIYTY
jgi:hypothetical protein